MPWPTSAGSPRQRQAEVHAAVTREATVAAMLGAMTVLRVRRPRRLRVPIVLLSMLLAALPGAASAKGPITIEITGLESPQAVNVRRSLSLARLTPEQQAELTPARLAFLLRRAEREALAALEPFGLYHAEVKIVHEVTANGVSVRLDFAPGEPVRVRQRRVEVHGPAGTEPELLDLLATFEPAVGEPFVHSRYEASKSAIVRELARRGYFQARLESSRVEILRAERSATIDLVWDGGPRHVFGATRIEGSPLKTGLLEALLPWKPDEPYHQDRLIDFQQRLTDLDYFSVVDIRPEPAKETAVPASPTTAPAVPIAVELTPAPRNVYSAALSFGTDSGAGIKLGYQRRWINRHGHKLQAEIQAAQRRQAVVAQYRIPAFGAGPGWWGLRTGFRNEDFEGFNLRTTELVGDRTWRWGRWNMTAAYSAQHETLGDRNTETGTPIVTNKTVAFPALTAQTRRSDDPVFTRRGWSLDASARGGTDALLSDVDFAQVRAEGRFIRPLGESSRLLLRAEAGTTWVEEIRDLPVGLRLFAGGDRSLRGYDLREVGPRLDGAVIGGRHLLVGSAEVDHFFGGGKWGMAAFVDAGDAVGRFSDYSAVVGAGLGLRWRSPVGPVRLDIARGFDNPDTDYRIHLTIGPDL